MHRNSFFAHTMLVLTLSSWACYLSEDKISHAPGTPLVIIVKLNRIMQPFDEFFGEMHMKITLGFDFFYFYVAAW